MSVHPAMWQVISAALTVTSILYIALKTMWFIVGLVKRGQQ
jgi:hypothetical protein